MHPIPILIAKTFHLLPGFLKQNSWVTRYILICCWFISGPTHPYPRESEAYGQHSLKKCYEESKSRPLFQGGQPPHVSMHVYPRFDTIGRASRVVELVIHTQYD